MTGRHPYSLADYMAAMGLTTALIAATPFFWAPPLWILAMLRQE